MNYLAVDIETYSSLDLKKVGVYAYVEDPTFEILMAGWSVDGAEPDIAVGEEEIAAIPGLFDANVVKVAHNAEFERVCLATLGPTPPHHWIDTMALAAENALPQGLEMLARRLKVDPKDPAGSALIRLFTRPDRNGRRVFPHEHPEKWQQFLGYCLQDVRTLVLVAEAMGLDFPTETEKQLHLVDQIINARGVKLDVELAQRAWEAGNDNARRAKLRLKEITDLANPNSVQQLLQWLRDAGKPLPNLQAATVQAAIDDPDTTAEVREVLELRQGTALIAAQKFEVALRQMSQDGRLRGQFRFHGAHTGRWAGRGVQLHNLPRAAVSDPESAILDLKLGNGADAHTLKALVRGMILGPMVVVDYSAIEARVLAWLAGEEWVLDAFRGGRDIYVETAGRMSTPGNTLTRFQGKVACVEEGSRVLTDKGLVSIEDVTTDHLMWDGVEWVHHEGVVFKGERDVIEYQGLRATPDHLVWIEGSSEPVHLGFASSSGAHLVQSGSGRTAIRLDGDRFSGETLGSEVAGSHGQNSMHWMRSGDLVGVLHSSVREVKRLPDMQPTEEPSSSNPRSDERRSVQMPERERSVFQSLRRSWDRVQVLFSGRSDSVGSRNSRSTDRGGSSCSSAEEKVLETHRRTARVYDIVNSGPRHRFTVSDVLVHNCLALGYQGALNSLVAMGAQGTDDELYGLVRQWRSANPMIVQLWKRMETGWDEGTRALRINFQKRGTTTRMVLPSGRALTYRWVKNQRIASTDFSGRPTTKMSRQFSDASGIRVETYGGRLTENATQAVARDILADALINLEREGYPVIGHVHDEVLVDTTDLAAVQEIMCVPPAWAPTLPLDAKGFVTSRYRKD